MSYADWMYAEPVMNQRAEERVARAQARRQARLLRSLTHRSLTWRARWLTCEVGYRLVGLGAWLEGTLSASAYPSESQAR
jgi:hypothetical protein